MQCRFIYVGEKAVLEILESLAEVAAQNGVDSGKEGMLALLGLAAGQLITEIEIETGRDAQKTIGTLMQAIQLGINKSRESAGMDDGIGRKEGVH